ncbi:hypothetical protein BCR39DRAFT_511374 [Naematelia encephala]|uniref:RING-type domain-containing protein n=1 Tax=Naematelia encephala TaxID=71784 RepID=A0A1Y2BLM5_9TREE|nr:hypothetical protein BCR39DRAFT_511374 [Naematelia encephala]
MDAGRIGRDVEAGSSRARAAAQQPTAAARRPRKKAKPSSSPAPPSDPIPKPYLALAPKPISNITQPVEQLRSTGDSRLILPSTYVRGSTSTSGSGSPIPQPASFPAPSKPKYANQLLSPPTIMPGGQPLAPRVQGAPSGESGGGRPRRAGMGGRRRSEERLREIGAANVSMLSLGYLGRIMESDPQEEAAMAEARDTIASQPPPERRRRRIVRGETGIVRRPTVSSREEGRALGLARGASMRRINLWEELPDLPESNDPPPAFPFPTTSTSRLPPTFESASTSPPVSPLNNPSARPRSPPPSFEQAIGLLPLPSHPASVQPPPPTSISEPPDVPEVSVPAPPIRPALTLTISLPPDPHPSGSSTTSSPTSTHYASAPESPSRTVISTSEEGVISAEERADRRMWNLDLLAGYTLEERVKREIARKTAREETSSKTTILMTESIASSLSNPSGSIAHVEPNQEVESVPIKDNDDQPGGHHQRPSEPLALNVPEAVHSVAVAVSTNIVSAVDSAASKRPADKSLHRKSAEAELDLAGLPRDRSPRIRTTEAIVKTPVAEPSESKDLQRPSPDTNDLSLPISESVAVVDMDSSDEGTTPTLKNPSGRSSVVPIAPKGRGVLRPKTDNGDIPKRGSVGALKKGNVENGSATTNDRITNTKSAAHHKVESVSASSAVTSEASGPISAASPSVSSDHPSNGNGKSIGAASPRPDTHVPSSSPQLAESVGTNGVAPLQQEATLSPSETSKPKNPSPAGSDVVLTSPGPQRKLTRGKPIRRSSSGIKSPVSSPSAASPGPRPLFSSSNSSYFPRTISMSPKQTGEPIMVAMANRVSEPDVHSAVADSEEHAASHERRRSEGGQPPRRLRSIGKSHPNLSSFKEESVEPFSVLPPHREAALKRRELAIARIQEKPASPPRPTEKSSISPKVTSGPLIDLNDFSLPPSSPKPVTELPTLAAATAELLALLEDDAQNTVAESSSQAAARLAAVEAVKEASRQLEIDTALQAKAALDKQDAAKTSPSMSTPPKRKPAPPPPPSLRTQGQVGVSRKPSVLSTADSPIIPRPIHRTEDAVSPTTPKARVPSIPTRRPPPPPPASTSSRDSSVPPPIPVRPPPPAFVSRPMHGRYDSSFTGSTTSSVSEKVSSLAPMMTPRPFWRNAKPLRPRGPRPPPVPPRPWAKVVADTLVVETSPPRPLGERTQSENATVQHEDSTLHSPVRSMSTQDLRSDSVPRSPVEYTDLDVLVSRIEGSGREYEGYSQITSFLGPAKSPAASLAALATLLPGIISVDSRRTTPQGKIKLKLSLLGVRVSKCPICLGQYKDKERGVMLPDCGHSAHEACARRWFREDSKCFVCREPLRETEGVI